VSALFTLAAALLILAVVVAGFGLVCFFSMRTLGPRPPAPADYYDHPAYVRGAK
jgi:hypothetical protein